MAMDIYTNPVAGGGIPATMGNRWFVDPSGSDGHSTKSNSYKKPFASIEKAISVATTNNHDVICLSGNAAHAQTEMLEITKNRLHFVGLNGRNGAYGMGARSRITIGVTTAATDLAVMQNTGVGNTFRNIKFDSSNTVAEGLYSIVEAGEYSIYDGCEFYLSSQLDATGAAEVANNGDSAQWLRCVFGSTANETVGAIIRANMLVTGGIVAGKKCRDNIVDDSIFMCKAGNTAKVMIYGANATDIERLFLVKNSLFFNSILATADPAHAVGFGAAQTEGQVILMNCTSVMCTVMKQASRNIYVSGAVPTHNTSGIAVTG